jgi:RNA polymerase sigma-70 factor, ECF subfamily
MTVPENDESAHHLALMERTRAGDMAAFTEIVKIFQQPLLNFFRRLGVHTDAEDMVQEVFIRLFRYRERYRPTAKLATFLYMLARQVRVDHIRKDNRREELAKELKADFAEDSLLAEDPFCRMGYDVEDCLLALPDDMREIVVLNIYQGMRYGEIAEVMEIPVGTVKSRMFYALRRMRERLDEQRRTENGEQADVPAG